MRLLAGLALAGAPLVVAGHPSVRPWPIGAGPGYRPAAAPAAVEAGEAVGGFRCRAPGRVFPFHLEIFADRRAVVVPPGIGVARPAVRTGASIAPRGCTYPLSTLTPAGIVEAARPRLRLGDLFRIWGLAFGIHRIGSFRSSTPVRAYVDGRVVRGPLAEIPLVPHDEIVLELGGYVPPHPFFLFAGGGA